MSEMFDTYDDDLKASRKRYRKAGQTSIAADINARDSLNKRWTYDLDEEAYVKKSRNQDFYRQTVDQDDDIVDPGDAIDPPGPMQADPQQPLIGEPHDQASNDEYFSQMFAKVGGLGRKPKNAQDENGGDAGDHDDDVEDEVAEEPQKKLGWGSRIWSGLKGLGQLALAPLISIGGLLAGAKNRFQRRRYQNRMNEIDPLYQRAEEARRQKNMQDAGIPLNEEPVKPLSQEELAKVQTYGKTKVNLEKAQQRLGANRRWWTQRNMVDNFSKFFTGSGMRVADNRKKFFSGGMYRMPKASRESTEQSTDLDLPADNGGNFGNVPIEDQQQFGGRDTLQYDQYGQPIYDD